MRDKNTFFCFFKAQIHIWVKSIISGAPCSQESNNMMSWDAPYCNILWYCKQGDGLVYSPVVFWVYTSNLCLSYFLSPLTLGWKSLKAHRVSKHSQYLSLLIIFSHPSYLDWCYRWLHCQNNVLKKNVVVSEVRNFTVWSPQWGKKRVEMEGPSSSALSKSAFCFWKYRHRFRTRVPVTHKGRHQHQTALHIPHRTYCMPSLCQHKGNKH